jgi:hypothetical protein
MMKSIHDQTFALPVVAASMLALTGCASMDARNQENQI